MSDFRMSRVSLLSCGDVGWLSEKLISSVVVPIPNECACRTIARREEGELVVTERGAVMGCVRYCICMAMEYCAVG
jgi:hypothetical protein